MKNFFTGTPVSDPAPVPAVRDESNAVEFSGASFAWRSEGKGGAGEPNLRDLSFAVPRGSLTAVVGMVGSGKSSLLSALLGDMSRRGGVVARTGDGRAGELGARL